MGERSIGHGHSAGECTLDVRIFRDSLQVGVYVPHVFGMITGEREVLEWCVRIARSSATRLQHQANRAHRDNDIHPARQHGRQT